MLSQTPNEITLFNYIKHSGLDFPMNIIEDNRGMFTDDFVKWLPDNIKIFSEFCERAIALKKAGRKQYGAKSIIETIRYHTYLRETPEYEFKINNNYASYLSRLSMLSYPILLGFFETRETKKIYQNKDKEL